MSEEIAKWIWQHSSYPDFNYNKSQLIEIISEIDYYRGILDGMARLFSEDDIRAIEIDTLTDEAINTSLIEGEIFKRESIRSSLRKKLDKDFDERSDTHATPASDNLVEVLLDCSLNKKELSFDRLHGWHNCLFERRYSQLEKITVAQFRNNDDMEVVSGAIGHEKVHYKAIPASKIKSGIKEFLAYCNKSDENIYIKSAIAHLWFVSIHPYDDGNGRIARAIADYILSKHTLTAQFKLYSISTAIISDRKGYYGILDKTTNLFINKNLDVTSWIEWHLLIFKNAMLNALKNIEYITAKTKFWDKHRERSLNKRQIKVLNKILNIGSENFRGGVNTKKYISITKASKATAVRDIAELIKFGCIKQIEGTAGRNIRYEVILH